jgi:hypothetical protein
VTETVIERETRDATGTATGTVTATEIIGTATDATPVSYFSLYHVAPIVADYRLPRISLQFEADAVVVAIIGNLKTANGVTATYVSLYPPYFQHRCTSCPFLILSVAGARVRLALALAPVPARVVVRLRLVADVRDVRALAAVLLVAVHAIVIANSRKRSHGPLVGQ